MSLAPAPADEPRTSLNGTPAEGLSAREAAARLAREGYNELPAAGRHSLFAIIFEVMREPMFALLLGAGALYAVLGDLGEALVLFGFATISVSIAVIQRGRSERVLEALRDLTSPRALVVRDGQRQRIAGRDVVRGDVIVLAEGDRVPADALLISGEGLQVDESLLTGESIPVRKRVGPAIQAAPGGDDLPQLYSGTLIVRGTGRAVVTATGVRSEIGRIGHSVREIETEPPRLQAQTRRIVIISAIGGFILSVLAVLLYGVLRGNWLEAVLGGIAIGMAMLPEEFPLVLTVFMVMGAARLSRSQVLTRRATAIETLGAATVLCTDKTGTLTRNMMSVVTLRTDGELWQAGDAPEHIHESSGLRSLLESAVLASDPEALDPMERALLQLQTSASGVPAEYALIKEYPLQPDFPAVTRIWQTGQGEPYLIVAKGAPEAIARLCALNAQQMAALHRQANELARQGIRVLAVAHGSFTSREFPQTAPELVVDAGVVLQLSGVLGFADPLRDSVPEAVRECRGAGVRIVMITGDYPETAHAIAQQAGIDAGDVLAGNELSELDDAALAQRVRTATVYARITPQQKLRIVNALKANGEVVAMTGDGVNDAPALKAAHIGIAMGGRGTDVAREASSLVLLDDDFGSIVRAIQLGRRIYDNLRKAMCYIVAIHVPIAGLALLPVLLGWPLLLTPMLIAFLELIIDPACSVVFEAERAECDVMTRPPRDPRSPLLSRGLVSWSLGQGMLALILVATIYLYAVRSGIPDDEVRALAFTSLVGANVALIFANRTFGASIRATFQRTSASLWWGLGLAGSALALVLGWPRIRQFFHLGPLHTDDVLISVAAMAGLLLVIQWMKLLWGQRVLVR